MPITSQQFLALVTERRIAATQSWSELLGGGATCQLDGSLSSHEGAKLREGEVAALGLVIRALRARPDDDIVDIFGGAIGQWNSQPVPGRGTDWEAYLRGGEDALESLRAVLDE